MGIRLKKGLDAARDQIYALEDLWSVTDENSDIYKANHSGGQAVEVSDETASLVGFALDMARQTRGALNPAIYPVLEAWGFTTDSKQVPSREEIDRLLENTDYTRIKLDGNMLTVPDGMEMDLGSVGERVCCGSGDGNSQGLWCRIGYFKFRREYTGHWQPSGWYGLAYRDPGALGGGLYRYPFSQRCGGGDIRRL